MTILDHLSLLHGWLPGLVAVGAWGTLFFGVAWWRRAAWHWIVLAAIAGGAAALIAWSLDIPARVGSTYPRSFLAWGALPLFALGAAVWQWTRVRWWRRVVGALAAPLLAMFGAVQINAPAILGRGMRATDLLESNRQIRDAIAIAHQEIEDDDGPRRRERDDRQRHKHRAMLLARGGFLQASTSRVRGIA